RKETLGLDAYVTELQSARGGNTLLDRAVDAMRGWLGRAGQNENEARSIAERLALLLQGALLVRHAPVPIADAFCRTRLAGEGGRTYGTLPDGVDVDTILARVGGA